MVFLIAFLIIIFGPLLLGVFIYNGLQRKKVNTEEQWSSIGALLQKRNDLIPSLVETVKGYAAHENETLSNITKLRSRSSAPSDYSANEPALRQALAQVFALAEQYPNLKADQNFAALQNQLVNIEHEIGIQRISYNKAVKSLNEALVIFPNNFVASAFKIEKAQFFMEKENAAQPPVVKF